MNWRAKAALGAIFLVLGALGALFMAGWLAFAECDAECVKNDDRTVAWYFLGIALAVTIGGGLVLRRGWKDRAWTR